MKTIKILVYDDQKDVRDNIKSKLNGKKVLYTIKEAKSDKEAIVRIECDKVDIILMDIDMLKVNGIEPTGYIMKRYPKVKILTLDMPNGKKYEMKMLEENKRGYVLKDVCERVLDRAIQTLVNVSYNGVKENGSKRMQAGS